MANDNDATGDDDSNLWVTPEDLEPNPPKSQEVIQVDFSPAGEDTKPKKREPKDRASHLTNEIRSQGGLRGTSTRRARHGLAASISKETYDHCAQIYIKDGNRSASTLAKACGVHIHTATRIIKHGYPLKGWKSLKERAEAYDKAQENEELKANAQAARAMVDKKYAARSARQVILGVAKAGYTTLFSRWNQECQRARFDLDDEETEQTLGSTPGFTVNAHKMILSGARLMQGFNVFSDMEEKTLGLASADELTADSVAGLPPGLAGLTAAQLDYITQHGGELPPDLTEEKVFGIQPGKQ